MQMSWSKITVAFTGIAALVGAMSAPNAKAQDKKPNIVVLMTDDTGWGDFGPYRGGAALGHPTPNVDRFAKEGAVFTSWYGQASCTAGRASFITGRIPIRSAYPSWWFPVMTIIFIRKRQRSPNFPEKRLFDLLLWQMASGRQT